jgi:hypothetical protein
MFRPGISHRAPELRPGLQSRQGCQPRGGATSILQDRLVAQLGRRWRRGGLRSRHLLRLADGASGGAGGNRPQPRRHLRILPRRSGNGIIAASALITEFARDSLLEGDGFELFVRGHESAESRSIPGVAGSSRTGEGDVGGGLHHRYRGSPVAPRICAVCVGHRCDRPRPVPGVDAPAARRHPRRTNLAGQLEERAHAPRLPARRAALQHLMRTLSITMPAESCTRRTTRGWLHGSASCADRARGGLDHSPAPRGAVVALKAPDPPRPRPAASRRRGGAAGDQPRRRRDTRLLEGAGAQGPQRATRRYDRRASRSRDPFCRPTRPIAARRDRGAD